MLVIDLKRKPFVYYIEKSLHILLYMSCDAAAQLSHVLSHVLSIEQFYLLLIRPPTLSTLHFFTSLSVLFLSMRIVITSYARPPTYLPAVVSRSTLC